MRNGITMRIDLHGLTLNEAYSLVAQVIEECYNSGEKKILFVTGRSGEIKREFPFWVENNSSMVREVRQHGNGAFIIFLRKK